MLIWSWGTWPDPVIDFGREIYVPWQLAEGQVLYRDIVSYFNGPLSPYAHALLFKIFGPSLRVLVIFNLILIALLAPMLYRLIDLSTGSLAATAGGIVFFVLFAFAQLVPTGNYNYVCPYSYELPHGITLSVAGILILWRWINHRSRTLLLVAGAVLGLVFLTKAEVFLAATIAMGGGFSAALLLNRKHVARDALSFVVAALAPPLIAVGFLSLVLHPPEALHGILGAWNFATQRELLGLAYFRELTGADDVPRSVATMFRWTRGYAVVFGVPALVGWLINRRSTLAPLASIGFFAGICLIGLMTKIDWNNFIRPAPLLLSAALLVVCTLLLRRRDERMILPLMLILFALAMLAKMALNAHIYHYGFALAMPGTIVLVAVFMGWLPRMIERAGGSGLPLRAATAAVLLVAILMHLRAMDLFFSAKKYTVGHGADRFHADARGAAVNSLLATLERDTRSTDTLVMIPEGLLVNYLARRINPTGQLNFTPPALLMYSEKAMVDAFARHPPDWIAILDIDTSEYGAKRFGHDYAPRLSEWINANYEPIATPGLPPSLGMLRRIQRRE